MFFETEFMKLYSKLSDINESTSCVLNEVKKDKNKQKVVQTQRKSVNHSEEVDNFLRSIGLVRISEIAEGCANFSPSGTAIWAPSERAVGMNYNKDIPYFNKLVSRFPRFVAELPVGDYPLPKWEPKPIKNNGDRKVFDVNLGEVNHNPWRGACFKFKVQDKTYFVFGKIFYKNYQKVNASTNGDIAAANVFYDKVMAEIEKYEK